MEGGLKDDAGLKRSRDGASRTLAVKMRLSDNLPECLGRLAMRKLGGNFSLDCAARGWVLCTGSFGKEVIDGGQTSKKRVSRWFIPVRGAGVGTGAGVGAGAGACTDGDLDSLKVIPPGMWWLSSGSLHLQQKSADSRRRQGAASDARFLS